MSEVPAPADPEPVAEAQEKADEPQEAQEKETSSAVFKGIRRTVKILILIFVLYYLVLPQIGGLRSAYDEVTTVNPLLLLVEVALEAGALVAYSRMTRACLPPASIPFNRLFRIQLATK